MGHAASFSTPVIPSSALAFNHLLVSESEAGSDAHARKKLLVRIKSERRGVLELSNGVERFCIRKLKRVSARER